MPVGVTEAAQRLGMQRQSVRKAIARGTLQATDIRKDGRRRSLWAIDEDEIERYRMTHLRPGHRRIEPEPSDDEVFAIVTAARIEGRVT